MLRRGHCTKKTVSPIYMSVIKCGQQKNKNNLGWSSCSCDMSQMHELHLGPYIRHKTRQY